MNAAPKELLCPRCRPERLEAVMTQYSVEVDACPRCKGRWLGRGEIFHFTARPKPLMLALKEAERHSAPGELLSPVTGKPMRRAKVFDKVEIDLCPDSGGLWLDAGEVEALVSVRPSGVAFGRTLEAAPLPGTPLSPKALAAYAAGARGMPNLALRSVSVLALLYAILGGLLVFLVETSRLSLGNAVAVQVGIVLVQFLFGPLIMDFTLRWLYQCEWVELAELPEHLQRFIASTCAKARVPPPRMGIIQDGAPNAFTYGHHPGNARVVITRGLFDLLEPEELEAVVAHEIGHAVQWDMLVMTVAHMVPMVAYAIYRTLARGSRRKRRGKGGAAPLVVAVGAYLVYLVTEYLVLWLSRTREYRADFFSGRATGDPNALARALVKIGYGLAARSQKAAGQGEASADDSGQQRRRGLGAIAALGIFDAASARALAVASTGGALTVDPGRLKGAMRWDLWNPWAKFYELNSTHPLIANRLDALGRQAAAMGKQPFVVFDETKPESYWDEFLVDLTALFLPVLVGAAAGAAPLLFARPPDGFLALCGAGAGMLLSTLFSYLSSDFPDMSVAALLRNVKVSSVRGVPCRVRGKVIGRGVPGLVWSEDFVIQDETGLLFLDYRQPLRIFEFLFGLTRRGEYDGEEVVATGWFRRAPVPYLELKSLTLGGSTRYCYVFLAKLVVSIGLMAIGAMKTLGPP